MRETFYTLIFLLCLSINCQAMSPAMLGCAAGGGAVASCTTPTGDELTESFGDSTTSCWSGGDSLCNNTWTKVGTGTISIDNTPAGADANTACTKAYKIDTTSATAWIYKDVGDGQIPNNVAAVFRVHIHLTTVPDLAQYGSIRLGAFSANSAAITETTNRYFSIGLYRAAAGTAAPDKLSFVGASACYFDFAKDNHYDALITLDAAGAANGSTVSVNGSANCTFTRNTVQSRYMLLGSGTVGVVGYFGFVTIATP